LNVVNWLKLTLLKIKNSKHNFVLVNFYRKMYRLCKDIIRLIFDKNLKGYTIAFSTMRFS